MYYTIEHLFLLVDQPRICQRKVPYRLPTGNYIKESSCPLPSTHENNIQAKGSLARSSALGVILNSLVRLARPRSPRWQVTGSPPGFPTMPVAALALPLVQRQTVTIRCPSGLVQRQGNWSWDIDPASPALSLLDSVCYINLISRCDPFSLGNRFYGQSGPMDKIHGPIHRRLSKRSFRKERVRIVAHHNPKLAGLSTSMPLPAAPQSPAPIPPTNPNISPFPPPPSDEPSRPEVPS